MPPLGNPAYLQIAERIASESAALKRASGRFPSARELARRWNLNSHLVNRAVLHLVAAGILRRQGRKLYLTDQERIPGPARRRVHVLAPPVAGLDVFQRAASARSAEVVEVRVPQATVLRSAIANLNLAEVQALVIWTSGVEEIADLLEELESQGVLILLAGCEEPHFSRIGCPIRFLVEAAFDYFESLGRREWAMVNMLGHETPFPEFSRQYRAQCRLRNLAEASDRIIEISERTNRTARHQLDELLGDPRVQAVLCTTAELTFAAKAAARRVGRSVPNDLSILAISADPALARAIPPITAIESDLPTVSILASELIFRALDDPLARRVLANHREMIVKPKLVERKSTAALANTPVPKAASPRMQPRWPRDQDERRRMAAATWLPPDDGTDWKSVQRRAEPLDLQTVVNRGLDRFGSWLGGYPLLHMPVGLRVIHGIPFRLIDPAKNHGKAALCLPSGRVHVEGDRSRPSERATIELGQEAESIHLLHASGYAMNPGRIGEYRFNFSDGEALTVELITYGVGPGRIDQEQSCMERATIQDWWPTYRPIQNAIARPVVISKAGDPIDYERTLYTLRWDNPRPGVPIAGIEIVLDADQPATFGILGITRIERAKQLHP